MVSQQNQIDSLLNDNKNLKNTNLKYKKQIKQISKYVKKEVVESTYYNLISNKSQLDRTSLETEQQ